MAGAAGLGVWTWFLAGQTLEVMDQWSSVASGVMTLVSLVVAIIGLIMAWPSSGSGGATSGSRSFRSGNAQGARVTFGDNSPINGRDSSGQDND